MKHIVVAGGSGFIGTEIVSVLLIRGYRVTVLDQIPPKIQHKHLSFVVIDLVHTVIDPIYGEEVYGIINLSGAPISGRWTDAFMRTLYESRINSTKQLVSMCEQVMHRPKVFINASAVGYYGDTDERLIDEYTHRGTDFLSTLVYDWEKQALRAETLGIRVALVRTASVIGKKGILPTLLSPFRYGVGGWFGSGRQWFPWVHIDDVVSLYITILENQTYRGVYNAVAPEQTRQKVFMKTVGKVIGRPAWFPVPYFLMRWVYKGFARVLYTSQRITSARLPRTFFRHQHLYEALVATIKKH